MGKNRGCRRIEDTLPVDELIRLDFDRLLENTLLMSLIDFCDKYNIDHECEFMPVKLLMKIQRALKENRSESLPMCSYVDLYNLGYGACAIYLPREIVLTCWPMFWDIVAEISLWIGAKEKAADVRKNKKNMYLKYGVPPFTSVKQFFSMCR